MTNRQLLFDMGFEDFYVFENPDYDSAIVGITDDNRVVYDYHEMILHLIENDNMTEEEAADFIDYNTIRTIPYISEGAPIVMYGLWGGNAMR